MTTAPSSRQAPAPYSLGTSTYLIAPVATLRSPVTLAGGAVTIAVVDPLDGHLPQFEAGDLLRIYGAAFVQSSNGDSAVRLATEFWSVGAIPSTAAVDVWLRVIGHEDRGSHFVYTVEQKHGPACQLPAGARIVNYGPPHNRILQVQASRQDMPQVNVVVTGDAPWDGQVTQVRLGRLDDLSIISNTGHGLAIGPNLGSASESFIAASDHGLHLSKHGLTVSDGQRTTVKVDANGGLKLGVNVEQDETTAFVYSPATESLDVRITSQLRGVLETHNDLLMRNGALTTARLAPSGEFALGPDLTNGGADVRYDPAERKLTVSGSLRLDGALAGLTQLVVGTAEAKTALFAANGDVHLGTNVADGTNDGRRFTLNAADGTLAIQAATTIDGPLVVGDVAELRGGLHIPNGAAVTTSVDPAGKLQLGPDVRSAEGTDVRYDPADRTFYARTLALENNLTLNRDLELYEDARVTLRLSPNGSARLGTDIGNPATTGLIYDAPAKQFTINAPTTIDGPVTFNQAVSLHQETTVHRPLRIVGEGAIAIGESNNILLDREGITMRLLPGENNSVKVLGIGRAALLNAYQTPNSIQQFDLFAYYSRGVPSLHGSLRLAVANVEGGEPDLYLRLLRYNTGARRIEAVASIVRIAADAMQLEADVSVNGNFEFSGSGSAARIFQLRNLPTRPNGLPSGAVWNDGGALRIVL